MLKLLAEMEKRTAKLEKKNAETKKEIAEIKNAADAKNADAENTDAENIDVENLISPDLIDNFKSLDIKEIYNAIDSAIHILSNLLITKISIKHIKDNNQNLINIKTSIIDKYYFTLFYILYCLYMIINKSIDKENEKNMLLEIYYYLEASTDEASVKGDSSSVVDGGFS
jgi:hypothetical protein